MMEDDEIHNLAQILGKKASTGELDEMLTALTGLYEIMTDPSYNHSKNLQTKTAYNKIVSYQINKFVERWGELFNDLKRFNKLKYSNNEGTESPIFPHFLPEIPEE